MAEVTLKAIEELLDLKLEEKLDAKLDEKLKPIQETLNNHTKILDKLSLNQKNKEEGGSVEVYRVDRLEKWGQKVGGHVGIKLEL